MAHLNNLIQDVYSLLKTDGWFTETLADEFAKSVSLRMQEHFSEKSFRGLRLSKLGPSCPKALWYAVHHPELAEPLPPQARFKYAYGHIIEALAICLAKAAGHTVTGEQDAITLDGIVGHRDCVIDGCIVDVKSSSSYALQKFKDGSIRMDDPFGYLEQLDAYVVGSLQDPLVSNHDCGYNWAIDKQLGHMVLYEHKVRPEHIHQRIEECKRIFDLPVPPACECRSIPDGKSGNMKLDVKASYSPQKYLCNPHLRTFLYASGPTYLTKVIRKPDVIEVNQHGKPVYH